MEGSGHVLGISVILLVFFVIAGVMMVVFPYRFIKKYGISGL